MKKIVVIFLIFLTSIMFTLKKDLQADTSNSFIDEQVYCELDFKVDNLYFVTSDVFLYEYQEVVYCMNNKYSILITKGVITSFEVYDNYLYILIQNKQSSFFYELNLNNNQTRNLSFDETFLYDFIIDQDKYYVVGSCNNDAVIITINNKFNITGEHLFNGDNKEEITNIYSHNDYLYICIYKDALSNNSEFISTGNIGEKKSIIVKLSKSFVIEDVLYLDEGKTCEFIESIVFYDDKIELILNADYSLYFYQIDFTLKIIDYCCIDTNLSNFELVKNYKTNINNLFIEEYNQKLYLKSIINQQIYTEYTFEIEGVFYSSIIFEGELYISLGMINKSIIVKLNEYQIIKNETVYVKNNSYEDMNNSLIVESYFEKLCPKRVNITPYFQNTVSGEYLATYQIIRANGMEMTINSKIIVLEYTNFIDGGIYKKGKELLFFGTCTIDGQIVYNGETLEEEGHYEITITNANLERKIYHIYIVNDYYFNEVFNNESFKYCSNQQTYQVYLEFNQNLKIKELIINDALYEDYELLEEQLKITFSLKPGINNFYLKEITFLDGKKIYINKLYSIYYEESVPEIILDEIIENEKFTINVNFKEDIKNFMYYKIQTKDKVYYVYKDEALVLLDNVSIYLVLNYFNTPYERLIYSGDISSNTTYQFHLSSKETSLISSSIEIDLPIDKNMINSLNVNGVEYKNYYHNQTEENLLDFILIITIVLFAICLTFLVIKFFIKKTLNRKNL